MQINFEKLQLVEGRLTQVIDELTDQREKINNIIKDMSIDGEPEETIARMKGLRDRLATQILTAMKMKEAVKRIALIYLSGEERIETFIDEGIRKKSKFRYCTYIKDNTDFDWSIK